MEDSEGRVDVSGTVCESPRAGAAGSSRRGIDYAWHGQIDPQVFLSAGYSFVCRYLSHSPSKDITLEEARTLCQAGIDIVLVWETTAARAKDGYDAGLSDAKEAFAKAGSIGMPSDRPIYFAIDKDFAGPEVEQYFRGVCDAVKPHLNRVGAYGGITPLTYLANAGLIRYLWQTSAWSEGKWHPRCHLQQFQYGEKICGASCDINRAMAEDFGQWRLGEPAGPGEDPGPAPATRRPLKVTSPPMTGDDVRWVQKKLCSLQLPVVVDGKYGKETRTALRRLQQSRGLAVDGICGPKTWAQLLG